MKTAEIPASYFAIILNAHLPYVVNHGTWPHGMEWLHEAVAETYLPLLRVLGNLERDGVPANFSINLSPILLEQLAHPLFRVEFPKYVARKIVAAREDEAYFLQSGDVTLADTARFWGRFYTAAQTEFNGLDGDVVRGFRHFNDSGLIEVLTTAATHGYLPLLGSDESLRAQIRTAVETHRRHFGRAPRGIWLPECGYRPAGLWSYPVPDEGSNESRAAIQRIGVEQALAESGLEFFFVDTHLVEEREQSLYQPYFVEGSDASTRAVTVFPRDPRTGVQVWSSDIGYPGDPNYLDFHKKRFPGGNRYWQVSGNASGVGDDLPYWPDQAAERVQHHADHFVQLVYKTLESSFNERTPPILCAPFDADLFGHWWFEGPHWLEAVARALDARAKQNRNAVRHDAGAISVGQKAISVGQKAVGVGQKAVGVGGRAVGNGETAVVCTTCSQYLDRHPRAGTIALGEGSWGTGGDHQVWLNSDTAWTYARIYPAETALREIATTGKWRDSEWGERIVRQMCRELLLLESSDWQSLITTGAARDYAEKRFHSHHEQFAELKEMWQAFDAAGALDLRQTNRLIEIEDRDNVFPEIDPALWATGARETGNDTIAGADADGEASSIN
jgi:1,4-alpha-glucan branching enzyme